MHKNNDYVQLITKILFSFKKNAFLCSAKLKTNLYIFI
jgi:hypothetical protein